MAENVANNLVYWLAIDAVHKEFLAQIRHWDNLKIAIDEGLIWIKDFTDWQLRHNLLHSIPFTSFYYIKDNQLFPKGSLLPNRSVPGYLWTPIEKAFPVTLQGFNHNFFALQQQQSVKLVPADVEYPATVLLVDIKEANSYITSAPAVRLQHLKWVLVNQTMAFIIGEPLLPLSGKTFWQTESFILPVGYDMEFPVLKKIIAQQLDPAGHYLIWWSDETNYCLVDPMLMQPLSIASWRLATEVLNHS